MSGIIALFDDNRSEDDFKNMLTCLKHRGTKQKSFINEKCALGIWELTTGENEKSDKCIQYKNQLILFDGEIYNKKDLRNSYLNISDNELNNYEDAEFFLRLWVEYGEKILKKINGQYSAVIYNISNNNFVAIRDFLGIKPLYFTEENGRYCFASEYKALNKLSWYQGNVKQIIPGCFFDGREQKKYFEINFETFKQDEKGLTDDIYKTLDIAVKKRVDKEKKVGVLLSGGIDSSIIAHYAKKYNNISLYTVGVNNCEDMKFAKKIAKKIKGKHIIKELNSSEILKIIDKLIWHTENYNKYTIINGIPQYYAIKIAKEDGVDEIICGDGSDEIFGGYDFFYDYYSYEDLDKHLKNSLLQIHRTECMRFDRITMMNTIIGRAPFLDVDMVKLAVSIKKELKYKKNIEKYILRKTFNNILPNSIVSRKKNNFFRSTGIEKIIEDWAKSHISDEEYEKQKNIYSGWCIRTKEELLFFLRWKKLFPKLFKKGAEYFNKQETSILNIGINLDKNI